MEHLPQQKLLKGTIERAIVNCKKIGKNNLTAAKVRARIATLKENWTQFKAGHIALSEAIDIKRQEKIDYFVEGHFAVTEENFEQALDFLSDCLEELEPPVSPNQSFSQSNSRSETYGVSLAHLPPIQLPPFDGNATEWCQFRDRFTTLIKNNVELNDFARMHFLTSSLTGRALETISSLPVTSDSFNIAWRTLTSRYENKRRSLNSHLSTLINVPALARESAPGLRSLLDQINIAVESLKQLDRAPAELWNDILVYITVQKLDPVTKKAWSLKEGDSDTPSSFDELSRFLGSRTRALEEYTTSSQAKAPSTSIKTPKINVANATKSTSKAACPICAASHLLSACSEFLSKSSTDRRALVKQHKRCFNCLSERHSVSECKSKYSCRTCKQKHHSLLHSDSNSSSTQQEKSITPDCSLPQTPHAKEVTSNLASSAARSKSPVLLATAWVNVRVSNGRTITVRALLDQGSEMTFISESLAQSLHAKRERVSISVSGVGVVDAGRIRSATQVWISPRDSNSPSFGTVALIMKSITSYAPKRILECSAIAHLKDLHLADPDPTSDHPINVLIGADLYGDLIINGVRKGGRGQPLAQNSVLGWVVSGPFDISHKSDKEGRSSRASTSHISVHHVHESAALEAEVRRFWEIEELPKSTVLTPQEEQCETHFAQTHSRDRSGRYIVRLPFKTGPPIDIGHSKGRAERWLTTLKRKFASDPEHKQEYSDFMAEYENLGHMRKVANQIVPTNQNYYIPHHAVTRDSSLTTRLRVVFNASSPTSNGTSLNDHLLIGPKLQSDIISVLLQWRRYKLVYTADIAKMYRQILVDSRDIDYQRILWHPSSSENPSEYQLLTVTYGTACAPFLALKVIKQLREDHGHKFPLAVSVLRNNIYVDDVLFGAHTTEVIRQTRDQLISLLRQGGFELRKWASNESSLLQDIDSDNHGLACNKQLSDDEKIKVLGIAWNPASDRFEYTVTLNDTVPDSKRLILSAIAKFYDPLGWVTPVTISAKILLQRLWQEKLEWDDKIPADLFAQWQDIYSHLAQLNKLRIPRWLELEPDVISAELHGFADASNNAYAAVAYLRVVSSSGKTSVTLLSSKSKVAPIKTLSIPRLELCAAVLLARLLAFIRSSPGFETFPCYCWTDSTVALAWIKKHPSSWKTFVANRVSEIQSRLTNVEWRHVNTQDNPADCASRGLLGSEIAEHRLWWHGPSWLSEPPEEWPVEMVTTTSGVNLEEKTMSLRCTNATQSWDLESRYSSWPRLIRVTAYILRFLLNCRSKTGSRQDRVRSEIARFPPMSAGTALSAADFQTARYFWIKRIQAHQFPEELRALRERRSLASKSSIVALNPFIDQDGILRVGGRIANSPFPASFRHPILLSAHPLVTLLIKQAHSRSLHAGPQLTLNLLRREFWILRARTLVRSVIHSCVVCARERAAIPNQMMGNLPESRVTSGTRSFAHCGVDYAGPMHIRTSSGRGSHSRKAYIALFVCMATKAVHLELVSDYSTNAFLNAYSRFCARRGLPQAMYSDNGTTFAGANHELRAAYRLAVRDPNFLNSTASDGVAWHFIPPSAPHFGGLWEAGVKSVKYHLRRVIGSHTLTVEEFSTLLCKVEACLNSRPISPMSDALDDYECLTPGHFLVGSHLTLPPEPSLLHLNENRLSRWQLIRHLTERFWKQWQTDYVNTMQQRSKWRTVQPLIKKGQLVLLRNSTLPPCKWELGRVTQCHPGSDNLTRVVTVKTALSEFRRPINKLCVLPVECEAMSNQAPSA